MRKILLSFFICFTFGVNSQNIRRQDTVYIGIKDLSSITYYTNNIRDSIRYFSKSEKGNATFIPEGNESKGLWIFYSDSNVVTSTIPVINDKPDGLCTLYRRDGSLYQKYYCVKGLKDGEIITYYKSGKIKWKGHNKNGKSEGKRTGLYENGTLKWTCSYKKGQITSPLVYYTEKGDLFNGIFTDHHSNGTVESTFNCIGGKPEGEWKEYNSEGKLVSTVPFKNGIPDGIACFYKKEVLDHQEIFKNGKLVKKPKK